MPIQTGLATALQQPVPPYSAPSLQPRGSASSTHRPLHVKEAVQGMSCLWKCRGQDLVV